MYKEKIKNLIIAIDNEYKAYEELKELFIEKKEILKKNKAEELGIVDNKILAINNKITKMNNRRKKISEELLGKDGCMSDFIGFVEQNQPEYKEKLEERKVKICNIFDELALLNNQNVELLKHGITITDRMLETIVDVFAPQGSNYNGAGKTDTHDLDMWTVNEEI